MPEPDDAWRALFQPFAVPVSPPTPGFESLTELRVFVKRLDFRMRALERAYRASRSWRRQQRRVLAQIRRECRGGRHG